MRFIGQEHIINQLEFMLKDLYKHPAHSENILLRAPSGYGKTTMAHKIARYLAGDRYQVFWADWTEWNFVKRVIFIDEIHRIKDFEKLFGEMDSGKRVFIFATNQDGNLPEAFQNRCTEFIFQDYSVKELRLICSDAMDFETSEESVDEIINAANMNPRVIKGLVKRLNVYFSENPEKNSKDTNFQELLADIFDIQDGLDTLARRYLVALEDLGGRSSLNLLKTVLHVDQGTLTNNVEPVLVRKGLVRITSKGRILTKYDAG